MATTLPRRLAVLIPIFVAGILFLTGIRWGLPSRAADRYLFGDRKPWTGKEILDLAGGASTDPAKGADVDLNPIIDRSKPLVLNETDAQRAEIVRRYRLFTYQPDEWNTLRSLAGMKPGQLQLDPRLYQYGGLWVYPIGGLLKGASLVGLIDLRGGPEGLAYYLDQPEAFARFYIVARLYSVAWGVLGAVIVFLLARRLAGGAFPAVVAGILWSCLPVVVNMAHEAKPHLAGTVLMLSAIYAASRFVDTGRTRWAFGAGILCGAAFGMVVSSAIIFIILPFMALLRPMPWRGRVRTAIGAVVLGFFVYAITNPYVWINLVREPAVLKSNLGTSTAMYHATGGGGLRTAIYLIAEGMSPVLLIVGAVALGGLLASCAIGGVRRRASTGCPLIALLAVPAVIVIVQFVLLAAGKPGEYGRFALLPNSALCVLAVAGIWRFIPRCIPKVLILVLICANVTTRAAVYVAHFRADTHQPTRRLMDAERIAAFQRAGGHRLALTAEPAPYATPPVDLWKWELTLLPRDDEFGPSASANHADVALRAVDRWPDAVPPGFDQLPPISINRYADRRAPISWAAKPFEILVARAPAGSAGVGPAASTTTSPSQTPDRP